LTPSVVSLDEDGQILVGMPARERLITHPERSAAVFKRYMGRIARCVSRIGCFAPRSCLPSCCAR
jgi:molecular chaperone DnaK (HSP70)